ncbi:MAG: dimethyl sulfoxide reductase anchor subunit [Rhodoferax sp.]|nr:dimethyl sulfoxide reductase anchor subunit [Rhodoferax sp.]
MSTHATGAAGFGPNPWQQASWDWRAAGNFIGGGAGAGLLVASALFAAPDAASAWAARWILVVGLALVGLGLLCVWLEIGRPLRALHVFFNPRTSWMSREAFVALFLFPAGLLALQGLETWLWVTTLLALSFLYCQSRMLPAARGIPAWRPKLLTPLMFATGLCEGCGIFMLLGPLHGKVTGTVMGMLVLLMLARIVIWMFYRGAVNGSLAPRARTALDQAGRWLLVLGTLAPAILLGASMSLLSGSLQAVLAAVAGAGAAFAGAYVKYTLVTRASFNQGFALTKLPVRGVKTSH